MPRTGNRRKQTVVADLDGTCALFKGHRKPFDYHLVENDQPNEPVIATLQALHAAGFAIVFLSGRENVDFATNPEFARHRKTGTCHEATERWLRKHTGFKDIELYLRADGDHRPDHVIKHELYQAHLASRDILFFLDDRDQVVDLWRDRVKKPCFQVAPGNF